MQKIETIFKRDPDHMKLVLKDEPSGEDVAWVFTGEGRATWKWDGTACLVKSRILYRRHKLKANRNFPIGWLHWSFLENERSGHGWLPVSPRNPADDYHSEAFVNGLPFNDGTFELVGPKFQGNPYGLSSHQLWRHGESILAGPQERNHEAIGDWLTSNACEGIVWWHEDGRMAKIKARDFGIQWPRDGGGMRPSYAKH